MQIYKSSSSTQKECQKYFHLHEFPNHLPPLLFLLPVNPNDEKSNHEKLESVSNHWGGAGVFRKKY